MRELSRLVRRRIDLAKEPRRDGGWTLVEMIVSMGIFTMLLAITFTIIVEYSLQTKDNLARTRSVDQAQVGLMQLDRQVRSGNVISDPALETATRSGVPPYYSLRVYTQTDGVYQCVQWRVYFPTGKTTGQLQFRSWRPGAVSTTTPWSTTARDLVKPPTGTINAADPTTWPPFFVQSNDAETSSQAQTIRVTLRLKDPEQRESSKPATVTSTLTGRNTIFGYPSDMCGVVPAP